MRIPMPFLPEPDTDPEQREGKCDGLPVELPGQGQTPTIYETGMNPVGSMQEMEAPKFRAELPRSGMIVEKG